MIESISEPCEEGAYRDSTTTFCVDCGAGTHSTSGTDKPGCGKILIRMSLFSEICGLMN